MGDKLIRVLVVDDSAVVREMVSDIISAAPGLQVAGTARDGNEALQLIAELSPDIVTLDVQMPRMDGLATLDAILEQSATPVIMVSALTQRAADVTLQALDRGALDYVAKPDGVGAVAPAFRDELVQKVRNMAGADVRRVLRIRKARQQRQANPTTTATKNTLTTGTTPVAYEGCCIAIGISTGGPPALSSLFQELQPPLPPIVIVQHMPGNFTGPFAQRLNSLSRITVKEAESGDVLKPNHALLAPGGRHLSLVKSGSKVIAKIRDEDPVSGHRPSVDVMMRSAAELFGDRCLGIIMTGMGYDGAEGCRLIREAGGYVLGQNEASSDVYGMNKVAFVEGNVDRQFALDELPPLVTQQCRRQFRPLAAGTAGR